MTDRPILFSAPMVRALLQGRKTQTRRILHGVPDAPAMDAVHPANKIRHAAPYLDAYCGQPKTDSNPRGMGPRWCWWTRDDRPGPLFNVGYAPGDRLWVREGCMIADRSAGFDVTHNATGSTVGYLADGEGEWVDRAKVAGIRKRPGIHMPRWASRLTLAVTDVRVERLQDISQTDAEGEGVRAVYGEPFDPASDITGRRMFELLWDHINGVGAWEANPWVAAISFTVERRNIDAPQEAA